MAEKKKQTYAQAIAELEEIVAKLQNNECEIDELKTYTNRSLSLLKFCKDKLFETDEEIKKMLEELDSKYRKCKLNSLCYNKV